jgi:hypothetical protein
MALSSPQPALELDTICRLIARPAAIWIKTNTTAFHVAT